MSVLALKTLLLLLSFAQAQLPKECDVELSSSCPYMYEICQKTALGSGVSCQCVRDVVECLQIGDCYTLAQKELYERESTFYACSSSNILKPVYSFGGLWVMAVTLLHMSQWLN
jgi:hypothetical protein